MQSFKLKIVANKHVFSIPFVGLKQGSHEFLYELDDQFFVEKGAEDFADAQSNVKLTLEKNKGFMILKFEVGGKANVTCDKCGNPLLIDLWDEFKLLVKLVDDPEKMNLEEEDPDIFYISRTESHLDVSDWLYEFSLLSVPTQRMCSPEVMGGPQCNTKVLQLLDEMQVKEEGNASKLWSGLDKFKEN